MILHKCCSASTWDLKTLDGTEAIVITKRGSHGEGMPAMSHIPPVQTASGILHRQETITNFAQQEHKISSISRPGITMAPSRTSNNSQIQWDLASKSVFGVSRQADFLAPCVVPTKSTRGTVTHQFFHNKVILRDLIAATGLVILLKLDSNHQFFSPYGLQIWLMTFKNNRAPSLCYFKLCASFQCHRLIQTWVTVRKRLIWVKIDDFFSRVPLKFDVWYWKTIGHLFYVLQAFCIISWPLVNSIWRYSPETPDLGQIRRFLEPCNLEMWRMTFKNNRTPLQCYFKLCASFRSHWCIQTWVRVRKRPIWVKSDDF